MRKEYGKALRTMFAAKMKAELRQFEEVKIKSLYFWPGDRAYRWIVNERLHCWIVLSPSKKDYDEFTVLVGWSKLGRYPELSMVPSPQLPNASRDEFNRDEYLARLPSLWTNIDSWWVVRKFRMPNSAADLAARIEPIPATTAREAVSPRVDDAILKIREFGVPYLEELARKFEDASD